MSSSFHSFSTNDKTQNENNSNFSQVAIGFPINNNISVSSGLLPYSSMGYHLDYDSLYSDLSDSVSISSIGNGGLSKYYLGTSIKLNNKLSIGINTYYLFGGLSRNKTADFNNSSIYNVSSVDRTNLTGIVYEGGLLFSSDFGKNKSVSIAVTYQDNANLDAKRTLLGTTYSFGSSLIIKDTFENVIQNGSVVIPSKFALGISYTSDKWLFLANYYNQNWSKYQLNFENTIEEDNLDNSIYYSIGAQYTPDHNSHKKYWKKIQYRIGGRQYKTYLNLRNNELIENSITLGIGLPHNRTNTFYNFSMEIGESGTTEENLIREQFLRFNFGVTFKGIWFVKRKYD